MTGHRIGQRVMIIRSIINPGHVGLLATVTGPVEYRQHSVLGVNFMVQTLDIDGYGRQGKKGPYALPPDYLLPLNPEQLAMLETEAVA